MPKKPARNAFYFFMKDIEPALRKEGRVFPNGVQDLVPIAHPRWKVLIINRKLFFFNVFSCVWMIWPLKFLIHDFFKFKFCIRLYPRKTRQSMKERPKNARNKWKESRVTVSEWIIKDNCSPYVYCHSKVCYLGYNIILCECNSAAYGS